MIFLKINIAFMLIYSANFYIKILNFGTIFINTYRDQFNLIENSIYAIVLMALKY